VLDMSTSVVAAGRVAEWRDRGEPIPPEWANETGALRPVGGFKGFGLALVVEALAGALTGAGTVTATPEHDDQGVLMIALDVGRLRPLDEFAAEVEQFIRYVRDVPLERDAPAIRMPGETTDETRRRREAEGAPVRDFTWRALHVLAVEFDVQPPIPIDTRL
jgi:LDH2 family malate/lactate/ureidoglycolate dehydrogenase